MKTEPQTGDRIALYGSLMRGLGSMDRLGIGDRLRFVGPCIIMGELFDLGRYPGMRHGAGRIAGELYTLLDIDVIENLDEFEGYAASRPRESLYLRETVALIEPPGVKAWLYVYNDVPEPGQQTVSGDWRAHLAKRSHG